MKVDCKFNWAGNQPLFEVPAPKGGLRTSKTPVSTALQPKSLQMKKTIIISILALSAALVTASAADVKETWEKTCTKCHGPDGKGQTKMGQKLGIKDYTDAKVQGEMKDEEAFKAIKEGLKDKEGKILMKPAEGVTDDEIKALVQHVRSFKK
jgi:cytochrome c551/c552